jgi:hypothetical protein
MKHLRMSPMIQTPKDSVRTEAILNLSFSFTQEVQEQEAYEADSYQSIPAVDVAPLLTRHLTELFIMALGVNLRDVLGAIANNQPTATLLLDPNGKSIPYFRYSATFVDGRKSLSLSHAEVKIKAKYAISQGDTLALLLTRSQTVHEAFESAALPPQALVTTELDLEVVSMFKQDDRDAMTISPAFKLVIILLEEEVPVWAAPLIERDRLKVVSVAS